MTTRITFGRIEELTTNNLNHMGSISFKRKRPGSDLLLVNLPDEVREIKMNQEIPSFNPLNGTWDNVIIRKASINFIGYVEKWLEKEKMYVAEATYGPYRWEFFLPRGEVLNGEAYKIIN